MRYSRFVVVVLLLAFIPVPTAASARTRLVLKSARPASTYYAMSVGVARAIRAGAPGLDLTVESSPGSMVNLKTALRRDQYLFTCPPVLVRSARAGEGEFTESGYGRIRALWPLPGLVMHWAVTEDSGIDDLRGLAGRRFIPGGAGSAGAKFTVQVFEALGLTDQVELVHLDLSEAVRAVKNRRAVGLATSSSPPASIIEELAAARGLRLLSLDEEDYRRIPERFDRYVIPAGLYPGVDQPVPTITLKVALYTTADLPEDVAYDLTRAFWENRSIWETAHPAMKLLDPKGLDALGAPLHPGALRYYRQAGLWAE